MRGGEVEVVGGEEDTQRFDADLRRPALGQRVADVDRLEAEVGGVAVEVVAVRTHEIPGAVEHQLGEFGVGMLRRPGVAHEVLRGCKTGTSRIIYVGRVAVPLAAADLVGRSQHEIEVLPAERGAQTTRHVGQRIADFVLRGFVDIEGLFTSGNLAVAVNDILPERLLAGFGVYAGELEEVEVVVGLAFAAQEITADVVAAQRRVAQLRGIVDQAVACERGVDREVPVEILMLEDVHAQVDFETAVGQDTDVFQAARKTVDDGVGRFQIRSCVRRL